MKKYQPNKIEPKWQKKWEKLRLNRATDNSSKEKKYILDMFPYPSGAGLHVGHVEGYTATDIYSRFLRLQGKYNVMHPIGWDAFGLPAENYAIKTGEHPDKSTHNNIKNFTRQLKSLGLSYDWDREIDSSVPEYYKWTQWFFLLLYKNGLAYRAKGKVNWCESCQTTLANEQAEGGKCERCDTEVLQKDLKQWFFRISDFIEDQEYQGKKISGLINGLDSLDWPKSTVRAQKNWIGRSEGASVKFELKSHILSLETIEVFTTRPDTLYGATFFVLSPEHPLLAKHKEKIENYQEVQTYILQTGKKTELERTDLAKEKSGVELKGIKVINPVNNEELPVFIADYVLMSYGTGAIMAVPAHDGRDFEFAQKYNLPIRQVVAPFFEAKKEWPDAFREDMPTKERNVVYGLLKNPKNNKFLLLEWPEYKTSTFVVGGLKPGEEPSEGARREIIEETGYQNLRFVKQLGGEVHVKYFAMHKNENRYAKAKCLYFELIDEENSGISEEEKNKHKVLWVEAVEVIPRLKYGNFKYFWDLLNGGEEFYSQEGIALNSGILNNLTSTEARKKIVTWLEENDLGRKALNYRLRDWLVSRQRYWGAPIPIVYCQSCGDVPVAEEDLPILLPSDVGFEPSGESPLKYSHSFQKVKCPKCGEPARREADTMDTFVCSSWYYLRFVDPNNSQEFAGKELLKKWLPVDMYMGGAEHTVLHLLYARFFTKVLKKYALIDFDEPFAKLRHQGIIMAEDGNKMSKSKGNVINPDSVIEEYGADALRMYEMFMGPIEDMKPWNTKGIVGISRFLNKVWNLVDKTEKSIDNTNYALILNKTIKKVGEDIGELKFNTAISALMVLANKMEKEKKVLVEDYKKMLIVLSPFAPHLCEELYSKVGNKKSIFLDLWPDFDKNIFKKEKITLILQVNGKVRDKLKVGINISEAEAKELAQKSSKIKEWIQGKKIKKIIYVKERLVNIVVK